MGMVANYIRVSAAELETYLRDSSKLEDRVYREVSTEDHNLIDLDKAWEGLFFLLTGASLSTIEQAKEPLSLILNTTLEIDSEQDMGYGPAMYNTMEQVKEISAALDIISTDDLYNRYDGKKMNALGVYPQIWDEEESIEYLIEKFDILKALYNDAVSQGQSVIFFIN